MAKVETVGASLAQGATVAHGSPTGLRETAPRLCQRAFGVAGAAGDDVDDAVDRVGAPQGTARSANHLDALHILDEHILRFPEYAGKEGGIDAAAIDEDEQLVGKLVVETAGGDCPFVGIDAGDLNAGDQAQGIRQGADAGTAEVFGGKSVHCGRHVAQFLRRSGDQGDLNLHQLFQAEGDQIEFLAQSCRGRQDEGEQYGEQTAVAGGAEGVCRYSPQECDSVDVHFSGQHGSPGGRNERQKGRFYSV